MPKKQWKLEKIQTGIASNQMMELKSIAEAKQTTIADVVRAAVSMYLATHGDNNVHN